MDRSTPFQFQSSVIPPEDSTDDRAWWFAFRGSDLVVVAEDSAESILPRRDAFGPVADAAIRVNFLGTLSGEPVFAVELPPDLDLPSAFTPRGLRTLYGAVDDRMWA